jgi:CRISPR-associated protein (TIGR03986 family)
MSSLIVNLCFLEPFRLMEWIGKDKRNSSTRWLRGQSFAKWHESKNGKGGRPFITGTLLRSSTIKAIEELLCLCGGKWNGISCCPGSFYVNDNGEKKPKHLRHRATLRWWDPHNEPDPCNEKDPDNACSLCLILGRYDEAGKGAKSGFDVQFTNLSLGEKDSGPWFKKIEDVGTLRVLNRVDPYFGKAQDFFRIWEVDAVNKFHGRIEIKDDMPKKDEIISLLRAALSFVDRICGAACRIETDVEGGCNGTISDSDAGAIGMKADELVKYLSGMEQAANRAVHLRAMADAIRVLRSKDYQELKLPEGDTNGHYLWDATLECGNTPRKLLDKAARDAESQEKWRTLCEKVAQCLYLKSKEETGKEILARARPLGDAEFVKGSSTPNSYEKDSTNSPVFTHEWIITGNLVARTPFYIGSEVGEGDQTSLKVLLGGLHYRIPHSVLRGVLRRDLRVVSGEGCQVELGPPRPCVCKVCRLMRVVTTRDSVSELQVPPDIRHRIRRNPWTGIVDEGALFDTEIGLEGVFFPFVLHVRGRDQLDAALLKVLIWWKDYGCFIGGQAGTGRGRFQLEELKIYKWDIGKEEARSAYCENIGFRGKETEIDESDLPKGLEGPKTLSQGHEAPFPWRRVTWKLTFEGPILANDPIAALTRTDEDFPEAADAVFFKKTRVKENQQDTEEVFALKGESLRGLVRTAMGRNERTLTLDHEDCDCVQCRVFGSEHQAGKVRFEDMTLDTASPDKGPEKLLDHVSVDRFDAGVVEKYDDRPLVGAPGNPVVFKGTFWIHKDIENDEKASEAIKHAFMDIRDDLYPVGAKGGIGYGWIKGIEIEDGSDWLKDVIEGHSATEDTHDAGSSPEINADKPVEKKVRWLDEAPELGLLPKDIAIYYPHYFLKLPEKLPPNRERRPIGHDRFQGESLTGKITCTLTTKTPLIVPDTQTDKAFEVKGADAEHKSHLFFRLGDSAVIPGAPLRAMVSSVFEALTGSCFRVMDQKRHLSWRMEASPDLLKEFKPGRVVKLKNGGGFAILEMEALRLPVYDKKDESFKCEETDYDQPTLVDKLCTDWAEKVRSSLSADDDKAESSKQFYCCDPNGIDPFALPIEAKGLISQCKKDLGIVNGYVYFAGPNKVEKSSKEDDSPVISLVPDEWIDIVLTTILTRKISVHTKSGQKEKKRCRPEFRCADDSFHYIMNKRCERVFIPKKVAAAAVPVPRSTIKRYEQLLKEYKENAKRNETPEVFRTRIPQNGTLNEGDLVYFREAKESNGAGSTVRDIIPVRISRLVSKDPIGNSLPNYNMRSCAHVCLEECDPCSAKTCPLPVYREGYPVRGLCPACHLFGTQMYKGRVRFGFALLEGKLRWISQKDEDGNEKGYVTLPLLEKPRPTWVMPDETSHVPGRKFYVHHNGWKTVVKKSENPITGEPLKPGSNNCSVEVLDSGQSFMFEVFFENLRPWELGLLLYSLELEEGMFHKMGKGKPLGFGSVHIDVKRITKRNKADEWEEIKCNEKPKYIKKGFEKLTEWFNKDHENNRDNIDHIKKLRKLLTFPPDNIDLEVRYPALKQSDDPDKKPGYVEIKKNNKKWAEENLICPWHSWWKAQETMNEGEERTGDAPLQGIRCKILRHIDLTTGT